MPAGRVKEPGDHRKGLSLQFLYVGLHFFRQCRDDFSQSSAGEAEQQGNQIRGDFTW